jgi:hypothetical protein
VREGHLEKGRERERGEGGGGEEVAEGESVV